MTKNRRIPFFNYPAVYKMHEKEILTVIQDVLSRGAYILQKDLEQFEDNLKNYLGATYAIGVSDGTNALILALRAAEIGLGDEVIFCSHTYVATAAAIHYVGAVPVPVDCGADHLIDPQDVKRAITPKTRAIIPTQLNGRTCDMDSLQKIVDDYGLLIVEDAAQALGSRFKNRFAGTFGLAGTFSFYPAKLLGCFGDGGAVVTNDDDIARKVNLLRDHGRDQTGEVITWGTNSRLDNLQAAVLDWKLKRFDEDIARRRQIAARYQHSLQDIEDLILPPPPTEDATHFDVYQNYELQSSQREALREFLAEKGVGTIIQWGGKAVHQLHGLGFDSVHLPVAEEMTSRFLMLPMHTALSNEEVEYICSSIREFYHLDA